MNIANLKFKSKTEITVVCSYCGMLIKGQKSWKKDFLTTKEISLLPVSHGICPKCLMVNFPKEYIAIMGDERFPTNNVFSNNS